MPAGSLPVKTAVLAVCGALLVGACSSDAEGGGSSSTTPDAVETSAPVTSPSASGSSASPDAQESSGSPTPSESDSADASPSNESSPPHSPRPSKSSSEAPAPPVMPAAAKENTAEGAEAFARWYVETLNHLYQHPKAGVLDKYAGDDCKTCANQSEALVEASRTKEASDGPVFDILGAKVTATGPSTYDAVVGFHQLPATFTTPDGEVTARLEEIDEMGLLFRLRHEGGWAVEKLHPNEDPVFTKDGSR
ncbi:hypothetical protein CYJ76_02850 [Kytococcus schroeteri]|uniref:DUF6318 domain-containing protein n=3 Tax=Kytococcus TaxID=57499 RepID=A0A2I1PCC1_9MICO|nr:hypothetical protein CYJ76_02850 [Kytococcus schroeteri]